MTTASPLYRHRALLLGVAHLSPTGKGSLRLEAQGLFTKRARPLGRRHLRPGLYQVALWPRTDLEGFVSSVTVASWSLLRPAPIGEVPSTVVKGIIVYFTADARPPPTVKDGSTGPGGPDQGKARGELSVPLGDRPFGRQAPRLRGGCEVVN